MLFSIQSLTETNFEKKNQNFQKMMKRKEKKSFVLNSKLGWD